MTEAGWLACQDAWAMMEFLEARDGESERKLHLFEYACFEHAEHPLEGLALQGWEMALRHRAASMFAVAGWSIF